MKKYKFEVKIRESKKTTLDKISGDWEEVCKAINKKYF